MFKYKLVFIFTVLFLLASSCSFVDKLKEKISSKKDDKTTKEETKETKEVTSTADLNFYNKYIDVVNKIQTSGDKVYKDYITDIPEPKSITKSSFIMAISMGFSCGELERVIKEYKRSYFDGGDLSKLNASKEMKDEIEGEFKNLVKALEDYHATAIKVSNYYSKGDFKSDLSKTVPYDEDMKSVYEKYKSAFGKFSDAVKKYKPKTQKRDPESYSNPDEKAVAVLMNAYESTLDAAEEFYGSFSVLEYKNDLSSTNKNFDKFKEVFTNDKNSVLSASFTDKSKYMKYSYEDYFVKMTNMFLDAANKFFEKAPGAKNQNEFNTLYDDVVNNYNYMITAYNTNINIVNTFQSY